MYLRAKKLDPMIPKLSTQNQRDFYKLKHNLNSKGSVGNIWNL